MHDENTAVRDRQKLIRRMMDARDIAIKAVQFDGGWKDPSTVLSWFPANRDAEPKSMSLAGFYRLAKSKALSLDLLSLLLPDGLRIVSVPEEIDHDEIATVLHDYLQTKERAHHPESPDGREISNCEHAALSNKVVSFPQVKSA
jgi:hypothetical protein